MIPLALRAASRSASLVRTLSVAGATSRVAWQGEQQRAGAGATAAAAAAAAALATCSIGLGTAVADDAKEDSGASSRQPPSAPPSQQKEPLTNNPLEYDPVTNEHTARMTMARAAALEHYQAGRYPQAEVKLIEALDSAKLGFDPTDPHIASCMNNLAEFYRNTGQYDKAEVLYHEALDLLESIFGERHWLYVSAMHNLALMHEARGELDEARDKMNKVMKLRLQMFGPRHFLYADSMFALAHIYRKLAARSRAEAAGAGAASGGSSARTDATTARAKGGSWFGWLRFRRASDAGSAEQQQVVKLMNDAIAIMEDAETVQVNVVLYWLMELSQEYESQGDLKKAIECMRKALQHFATDKGEPTAQASQLNDKLVDLLMEAGLQADARTAMQACVSGRSTVFGRELVVAQSMLRLATIEAGMKTSEADMSAVQNAANAASLSQELLKEYSKPAVSNWMGSKGQDKSLKRIQAGNVCGSAYKFLAAIHKRKGATAEMEMALHNAVEVLQGSSEAVKTQLKVLQPSGKLGAGPAIPAMLIEEVTSLYLEIHLALIDCLEQLSEALNVRAQATGMPGLLSEAAALSQQAEVVAEEMLKIS